MKTFDNLVFEPHNIDGIHATEMFDNGYGVSVIKNDFSYGGDSGYYELAVLNKDGGLSYSTPVTEDVEGWLTPEMVTNLMSQVQELPKADVS